MATAAISNSHTGRIDRMVDDDLGVIAAESENPRQRRVGRIHVVKGADTHPIKPLSLSVD
jgi:hypothetical protein